jgi:hypothetical protein
MSDDRDAMTLDKARAIARGVAHQHGGAAQALAALDAEITRLDREIDTLKADIRTAVDSVGKHFPTEIFLEPPAGKHGKSVDGCTARGVRHAVGLLRLAVERVFVGRSVPADACRVCRDLIPELLISELWKRGWHRDQAKVGALAHWGKQEEKNIGRCLTQYTVNSVCGDKFTFSLDSGD